LGGQKNKDQVQSDLDPKPWALIGTSRGGKFAYKHGLMDGCANGCMNGCMNGLKRMGVCT